MSDNDDFNPHDKIGQLLDDGRLRLVSVLGMGSFAVVYLAESTTNPSDQFAVKCLFKSNLTPTQLALQHNEATVMSLLSGHDHIVKLFKTIDTDDCLYLVLEYCDTDLFDLIEKRNGLDPTLARTLFHQLLDASEYCHSKGIYHRDLKPENVLVTFTGDDTISLKLTDFGLATTQEWSTEFGCGSVRYMAPECLDASGPGYSTPANDVWGLGIMLINLLTGQNPWIEPTATDPLFETMLNSGFDPVRRQFGFSESLGWILERMFCLDPFERASLAQVREWMQGIEFFESVQEESTSWSMDMEEMDFETVPVFDEPKSRPSDSAIALSSSPNQETHATIPPVHAESIPTVPPSTPVLRKDLVSASKQAQDLLRGAVTSLQCWWIAVSDVCPRVDGVLVCVVGT
ncbi:RAN protein kinase [Spizellomyces punctatus DAOM BR117]|uniref:RAN protein kinase n=1 Tax=Spizellomyces punctatus (strain DAOM BR117) TaxID=645134 RepID=A0A0L0HIK9_SPIPD|nr:RAN protein kinase [Spizellomyces punctatus DAOM BR117]KND01276.1 RAN protein kinase [Spizellomyces punctatus DAOM BR117]|eukprot:XP_016609315.1 RAN protein kinase [Spizellomyces punctatus DAOM BR117]